MSLKISPAWRNRANSFLDTDALVRLSSPTLSLMSARRSLNASAGIGLGFDKLGLGVLLYAYAVLLGAS